jgi:hypothetical protein
LYDIVVGDGRFAGFDSRLSLVELGNVVRREALRGVR